MFGKFITNTVLVLAICIPILRGEDKNLPLSREARLIEIYSPDEWLVEATGIAESFKEAVLDARRVAVWWLLFGERGILLTAEERHRAEPLLETLFEEKTLRKFVTWTATHPKSREGEKVVLELRINREWVKRWLREKGVLTRRDPFEDLSVVILPEEEMETSLSQKVGESLESFATTRGWRVYHSKQAEHLEDFKESLMVLENGPSGRADLPEDTDAVISYRLSVERGYTVCLRTRGLRGRCSECGTVQESGRGAEESVAKAAFTAMEGLLLCLEKGGTGRPQEEHSQRLIISLSENFTEMERTRIAEVISDLIGQMCLVLREDILTDYTLDYRVVIDRMLFPSEKKWFQSLRERFTQRFSGTKLILLDIEEEAIFLQIKPLKGGE